jgi:hypothetical protein
MRLLMLQRVRNNLSNVSSFIKNETLVPVIMTTLESAKVKESSSIIKDSGSLLYAAFFYDLFLLPLGLELLIFLFSFGLSFLFVSASSDFYCSLVSLRFFLSMTSLRFYLIESSTCLSVWPSTTRGCWYSSRSWRALQSVMLLTVSS